ncbi:MAG: FAD-binding oxidoreductase [Alphaproteobacteria bacterium]|nr:FAD-binding oxidoreductase [Alphaproteobacteria bacterium]
MAALHVMIIGAGTLGLSSALHLAERGVAVTVIEADGIASGSTGRSIGVVGTQHVTALDVELRAYGSRRIREWAKHGLDFQTIGYLRLGRSTGDLALFEQSLGFQRNAGITSARILEPAEIRRLVPDISTEGIDGGLFGPEDGFLDPHRFASLLAEKVREHGGSVQQGCRLLGADRHGSGYRLKTSTGEMNCDAVVIAAGPWAGRVADLFGHSLPIRPERHEAVTIRLPKPLPYVMPMVMDLVHGGGGTGLNFRHDRPSELVAEIHSASGAIADPDAYDEQIADASKEHLAQLLLERLPGLDGAGFGRGWAGLYPETPDGRPFVGPFDGEPRLIAAAGAGGYGIQLAPVIGALVADWLVASQAVAVPGAAGFRPSAVRIGA